MDEDYQWLPAETIEGLRLIYNRLRYEAIKNKRYIVDRILDGDWRRGLSLYQVATIDFQCLSENEKAFRWTALKLVPQSEDEDGELEPVKKRRKIDPAPCPTVSPSTFLRNLQHEVSPLVKAHYQLQQLHTPQNLSIIRICVADSPYLNPQSSVQPSLLFTDPNRVIFIAMPDSCPYIYVSVSGAAKEASAAKKKSFSARMDTTSLKRTVLEEIPKALGKSQYRYSLESTSLTARSLTTLLALRGNSGKNAANGIYTIFANGAVDNSPVDAEKATFAEKILQACETEEDNEHNLNLSKLSLNPRQVGENRTALVERSTSVPVAKVAKSEDGGLNLKLAAAARFGIADTPNEKLDSTDLASATTTPGLDRLRIRLDEDLFSKTGRPSSIVPEAVHHGIDPFDQTAPSDPKSGGQPRQGSARMTLTFQGSNVFLGIRKLVESGVIGVEKLPAWMTGEDAISGGTVRHGIVVHGRGGGA